MAMCGQALLAPTSSCPSAPKPSTFLGGRVGAKESGSGLGSHSTTITRSPNHVLRVTARSTPGPPGPSRPSVLAPPPPNRPPGQKRSSVQASPALAPPTIENGTLTVQPGVAVKELSRADFPADFSFGAGISAFQAEGNPYAGGRGNTIQDSFEVVPGKIVDGSLHHPGCDFYNLFEEDIKVAKEMGLTSFRFSISWTRIYPNGGQPGERESIEGVQFYNRLINAIISAGMTPLVTLFHWEVPQYLENDPEVLGFRTKNIVPYFVKLAETCFKHFGDRVKHWVTFNEMWTFCVMGYAHGRMPPARCSSVSGGNCFAGDSRTEIYIAGHNMLLAHAKVYRLYDQKYKAHHLGVVGFNPSHFGGIPYSDKIEDKKATERYLEFNSGWQIDPVVFGDYPKSMKQALGERLPEFTPEEKAELQNSCDFLGHNYYLSYFIKNAEVPQDPSLRWYGTDGGYKLEYYNDKGEAIGVEMVSKGIDWIRNCAEHLPTLIEWLDKRYGKIPCYITENGCPDDIGDPLKDTQRIGYLRDHLAALAKAINAGANVIGYYYWSFFDVFEWTDGNAGRLGLLHVDFGSDPPKRTNKDSAEWYKKFLTEKTT